MPKEELAYKELMEDQKETIDVKLEDTEVLIEKYQVNWAELALILKQAIKEKRKIKYMNLKEK